MKFAHELRSPDALNVPRDVAVDPRELQLARQLIDSLAADWKPEQYRDSYVDALRQVIEQKVEGKKITAPVLKPRAEVRDSTGYGVLPEATGRNAGIKRDLSIAFAPQ